MKTSAEMSPERRRRVDEARERWIRRLVDLSRRNSLLYFRDLKTGTLDLSDNEPHVVKRLLSTSEAVSVFKLAPRLDEAKTPAVLQRIRRAATANREEKGIETLYLALGLATWETRDGGRPPAAPVLLVPIAIETRGRDGRPILLRRIGDIQISPVLLNFLADEFGCEIRADLLLTPEEAAAGAFEPTAVYDRLTETAADFLEITVAPRVVLGNFTFQKLAMVTDLRERGEEIAQNDLIAAIAGDKEAARLVAARGRDIVIPDPDRTRPHDECLIRDADSSQHRVINAVLSEQDGIIQGPPGTGKSQTISNLVAVAVARGRRVLFVAEKRAALDVVKQRLDEAGLGHLVLDLHRADVSRQEVIQQIKQSLDLVKEIPAIDSVALHDRFADRRDYLNAHVRRLHTPRPPSELSASQLMGRQLQNPKMGSMLQSRWRGEELRRLTAERRREIKNLLAEAGGHHDLFLRTSLSPWNGAQLRDGNEAQRARDLVVAWSGGRLSAMQAAIRMFARSGGLTEPRTLGDAFNLFALCEDLNRTLSKYSPSLFTLDLQKLASDLAPGMAGTLRRFWAGLTNNAYQQALTKARSYRSSPQASQADDASLAGEIASAADQVRRWQQFALAGSRPHVTDLTAARREFDACTSALTALGSVLDPRHRLSEWNQLEFGTIEALLKALHADRATPLVLPRLCEIEKKVTELGAERIIQDLRPHAPNLWPDLFDNAWYASCLEQVWIDEPMLAAFQGRIHEQAIEEFRSLDRERFRSASAEISRRHAERVVEVMNAFPEQAVVVRREANKKRRHLPIRTLLRQAPDVLTALRPCWMASPLSVCQLVGSERTYFDVVIFDEASQILPEDAIPSLLRARRAVVAGDSEQLPPTTFFETGDDYEEEDEEEKEKDPTAGFESILDLMKAHYPPWQLEWHYRSRDERLIWFSNHHIYHDSLVTFPAVRQEVVLRHVLVDSGPAAVGAIDSVTAEVQRVVDLVLEHARTRPRETLGVIALGIRHANRVEAALDEARARVRDLDDFFDEGKLERFFVKNLERVQGDERDAIILTVGVGKDATGKVHRIGFGPLNGTNGRRRLNVAVTRARNRLTVVSSFGHVDVGPSAGGDSGVDLLRNYLEYAARGGQRFEDRGPIKVALNPFEENVFNALVARSIPLIPQFGVSKYRIDIVAQHPNKPGQFVLAIECDGATYHSMPTARDRDRLRQQHLEALGWRFHRIWSTDWYLRRDEEVERAVRAWKSAVIDADRPPPTPTRIRPDEPLPKPEPPVTPKATRGSKPIKTDRPNIDDYRAWELQKMVLWVQSDGVLRTDDEVVDEVRRELGFKRRGAKIEQAIRQAIQTSRKTKGR